MNTVASLALALAVNGQSDKVNLSLVSAQQTQVRSDDQYYVLRTNADIDSHLLHAAFELLVIMRRLFFTTSEAAEANHN